MAPRAEDLDVAEVEDTADAAAEHARLAALAEYDLVPGVRDAALDAVTRLAASLTGAPLAVLNVIDATRQIQVSACGAEPRTTARSDSMCAVHFTSGNGVEHVPDASRDARYGENPWVRGPLGDVRMYTSAPLVDEGGYTLGTLCVVSPEPGDLCTTRLRALEDLAQVATGLLSRRRQARLVARLATTDALTGLPNRRGWDHDLGRLVAQASRSGRPLVVALTDLDHFKRFNDAHGHQAGDRLLQQVAQRVAGTLRAVDVVARWGGEELAVALPDCDVAQAHQVLDRVRRAVPATCTLSLGFAVWDGAEPADALLRRADAALYTAKAAGRDRVVGWAPEHDRRCAPLREGAGV